MKKLNLISLIALALVNIAFAAYYIPQSENYQSEFWIYPNTNFDTLKFASVLNSREFDVQFENYLNQKNAGSAKFEIKAHVKKNDIIIVTLTYNNRQQIASIRKNLQDFTRQYFEENQLKSTNNSDLQIFILNDILNLYKKEMSNYSDQEKNYLDTLGFTGQLIKNTLALRASLYIDSRIFNIDIDSISKALSKLQESLLSNKKTLTPSPAKPPLNYSCNPPLYPLADLYFRGLPAFKKDTDINQALLEKSLQYNYRKQAIELSEDRKTFFERKLRGSIKIIADSEVFPLYSQKDVMLNMLILNVMALSVLIFFNRFEIKRRQS